MVDSIAARYYVRLLNQGGVQVALFDSFEGLELGHIVDDVGYYNLTLVDDGDSRLELFELDGQIEIYRKVPGVGLNWYDEFAGFHRRENRSTQQEGKKFYVSSGVDYNELLARRRIGYKGGTVRADKNAVAETVMKEYVEENCGASATVGNGREITGVFPNFTVQSDGGAGIVWAGSRPFDNLLDVIKDVANFSLIDFQVIGSGPAQFVFQTFEGQLGADRTTEGLSGKLNGAGNPPVIFSVPYGNLQSLEYSLDRSAEGTVVFVLGSGEGSTRTIITRENSSALDDSPWNRRELSIPGSGQEFEYQLQNLGDETLEEMKFMETFTFAPLQQPKQLYGLHYFLGDQVTMRYGNIERNKRIVSVKITVAEGKEDITMEFADIPRRV